MPNKLPQNSNMTFHISAVWFLQPPHGDSIESGSP